MNRSARKFPRVIGIGEAGLRRAWARNYQFPLPMEDEEESAREGERQIERAGRKREREREREEGAQVPSRSDMTESDTECNRGDDPN